MARFAYRAITAGSSACRSEMVSLYLLMNVVVSSASTRARSPPAAGPSFIRNGVRSQPATPQARP